MNTEIQQGDDLEEGGLSFLSEYVYGNKIYIFMILLGLILLGSGIWLFKSYSNNFEIEIIEDNDYGDKKEIIIEIAGAVENPGVYKFSDQSRVDDLLYKSGGLSADADIEWVEKYINRAAKLSDGQKYYIPKYGEQTLQKSANDPSGGYDVIQGVSDTVSGVININTANQKELESLPGIGPVYAQSIIEHRPYSSVEDLLNKEALKSFVYEKIKDKVSVY